MEKFQCLLFVLKGSYICDYIICMTVPLNKQDHITSESLKQQVPNKTGIEATKQKSRRYRR